jgi:hypothetical protein
MDRPDEMTSVAAELAGAPGVCVRLLAAHVAGPDGRCVGCRSAVRLAPRWPCRLATIARLAADGAARRSAQPGLSTGSR